MSNSFANLWTVICPYRLLPARLLSPWDFLGKITGVGCHFLLRGIFLTQEDWTRISLSPLLQADSISLSHWGENINQMFDKRVPFKIDKELRKLCSKKKKNLINKWAEVLSRHLPPTKKSIDGQQVHEMMFNIILHQKNTNQNQNEMKSKANHNNYYQKIKKPQMLGRMWRKGILCAVLVSMKVLQPQWKTVQSSSEIKNTTPIWFNNSTSGYLYKEN